MASKSTTAVYFAKGARSYGERDSVFKIGHSVDANKRIYQLNNSQDVLYKMTLIGCVYLPDKKTACRVEREFQKILANYKSDNYSKEWFKDCPEVENFINSVIH